MKTTKNLIFMFALGLAATIGSAATVITFADITSARHGEDDTSETPRRHAEQENEVETHKSSGHNAPSREVKKTIRRERLSAVRLKACEARQEVINTRISAIKSRAQSQLERMNAVEAAVQNFVKEKSVTVPADILSKVATTKTAANQAGEVLGQVSDLNCTSDGPKADLQDFRNKRLDKVKAFVAYRNALKSYIQAVKSALKDQSTSEAQS